MPAAIPPAAKHAIDPADIAPNANFG